jgi:hypothetical protein
VVFILTDKISVNSRDRVVFEVLTAVAMKSSGRAGAACFHAGFLLGLFFDPEDGVDIFLLSIGRLSTDYMALYKRNC